MSALTRTQQILINSRVVQLQSGLLTSAVKPRKLECKKDLLSEISGMHPLPSDTSQKSTIPVQQSHYQTRYQARKAINSRQCDNSQESTAAGVKRQRKKRPRVAESSMAVDVAMSEQINTTEAPVLDHSVCPGSVAALRFTKLHWQSRKCWKSALFYGSLVS